MDQDTLINILTTLITQLGTVLTAIWWLSKRIDKLEAKFEARLNNGLNSRITDLDERLSHMEGRCAATHNRG
jgi:hypothetical protein